MNKFSIILPVKNGGDYLKECVNSILSQTYTNFNLLILENCSTDNTLNWLMSLHDDRIKIYPSSESLVIEENWARVLSIPKNEFMTLIGHDDILLPNYLQVMNDLIIKYPDASLYQAHFNYIDSVGNVIRHCKKMNETQYPEEVLGNFMSSNTDVLGTGFMMRSEDYNNTGGIPQYPSLLFADFELWINLSRKGFLAVTQENTFAFRIHQSTTSTSSDLKMLEAFDCFIKYLEKLQHQDKKFLDVITDKINLLLNFYCRGLTSRLIRSSLKKRNGLLVKQVIKRFENYAIGFPASKKFNPFNNLTILLAYIIDSNFITRFLFLVFKKTYSKPLVN